MSALPLAAVGGLGRQLRVALSANHLITLELSGERGEGGLNLDLTETTSAETQHQVEGRLLLDVVVGQGASILELLAREDQTLLIRGDAFFVLNFSSSRLTRLLT